MSTPIRSQAPARVHHAKAQAHSAAAQKPKQEAKTTHRGDDSVTLSDQAREFVGHHANTIGMGLMHGFGEGLHKGHQALGQVGGRIMDATRKGMSHSAVGPVGEFAAKHGKVLGKAGMLAGAGVATWKSVEAWKSDKLDNAKKGEKIGGALGEFGGAAALGAAGAQWGATLGVAGGLPGIAVGGLVGGIGGAVVGGLMGEAAGGFVGERVGQAIPGGKPAGQSAHH